MFSSSTPNNVIPIKDANDMNVMERITTLAERLGGLKYGIRYRTAEWLYKELGDDIPGSYASHGAICALFPSHEAVRFKVNGIEYYGASFKNTFGGGCDRISCEHPEVVVFSHSIEDGNTLFTYLNNTYEEKKSDEGMVYVWDSYHRQYMKSSFTVEDKDFEDLVGVEEFFALMKNDLRAIEENEVVARKLGACNGFNYLIYGRPGTGKTSAAKALAKLLNIPIYIGNLNEARSSTSKMTQILNPKSSAKLKLVVVEDFDRYIDCGSKKEKYMSALLNGLEGIQDNFGTIRIFSANFPENALQDEALASRITRFIHFDAPTLEHMVQHILNVYPECDEQSMELAQICKREDMTIRDINRYLSRYVMHPDPLGEAITQFDAYTEKMKKLKEMCDGSDSDYEYDSDSDSGDEYYIVLRLFPATLVNFNLFPVDLDITLP
jgi:predicted AAA+ superfamily ATPase